MPRRSLAGTASLTGHGLHTGALTTVTIAAGEPGLGIRFHRSDLPDAEPIPARVGDVRATERRTAIGVGAAEVQTIEHLMAALHAASLDDVAVSIDGPELPMADGSFAPWLELIDRA
ncbi:MAG TPA: UDP-3-O-acyl-N-acetylglucosamine deacetylase, partial [Gemmatimonadales bacterium]|nr:UDP-3-O-acyl-N-acetylglucosamine deacetylase [Gemmatimonadales bacterium]